MESKRHSVRREQKSTTRYFYHFAAKEKVCFPVPQPVLSSAIDEHSLKTHQDFGRLVQISLNFGDLVGLRRILSVAATQGRGASTDQHCLDCSAYK